MAKSGRGRAPRDRKRPYGFPRRIPDPPCTPKPPRVPPPPRPSGPGERLGPDPLEWLKDLLERRG